MPKMTSETLAAAAFTRTHGTPEVVGPKPTGDIVAGGAKVSAKAVAKPVGGPSAGSACAAADVGTGASSSNTGRSAGPSVATAKVPPPVFDVVATPPAKGKAPPPVATSSEIKCISEVPRHRFGKAAGPTAKADPVVPPIINEPPPRVASVKAKARAQERYCIEVAKSQIMRA